MSTTKLPYLSNARRKLITQYLAHQIPKAQICRLLRICPSSLYLWLREDKDLAEAVKKLSEQKYEDAMARLDEIAFERSIKPTAETQLKALLRIVDGYEAKVRRESGQITRDGAAIALMGICKVLVDMPEARMRILAAYSESRDEAGIGDVGSGVVPPSTLEGEFNSAGSVAEERGEDHDS